MDDKLGDADGSSPAGDLNEHGEAHRRSGHGAPPPAQKLEKLPGVIQRSMTPPATGDAKNAPCQHLTLTYTLQPLESRIAPSSTVRTPSFFLEGPKKSPDLVLPHLTPVHATSEAGQALPNGYQQLFGA